MRHLFFSTVVTMLASAVPTEAAPEKLEATHRQADILKPAREGTQITLSAFAVEPSGNIVAAVRSSEGRPGSGVRKARNETVQGWLQVYSPEKKLLREIPLYFAPTSLAITPDGHYLAAGNGHMCKSTADGNIVERGELTKILGLDPKKLRDEAIADYRKEQEEMHSGVADQRQSIKEQIARLEAKKPADRTARDKARLESLNALLAQLGPEKETAVPEPEIEQMIERRMYIPSISATSNGAIVTLNRNRGYEVWRTGPKFEDAKQVITGLRGCCGQMDVFAAGDRILTAENTKFRVGVYDLDGKPQSAFGERYAKGNNGFGSCCNPMNVTTCSNGEILTAESSIGHLKRFSPAGKLVSIVGRARIGGGCKHVSLGHDAKLDRYYVQYQDLNHICVLLPNKEAEPLLVEQDKAIKQAEATALKLAGKWKLDPSAAKKAKPRDDGFSFIGMEHNFSGFEFRPDRSLTLEKTKEERRDGDNGFRRWVVTGLQDDRIVCEVEEDDGYVEFVAQIAVKSSDVIELTLDQQIKTFRRQK
jgi:hypothetical protein